MVKLGTYSAKVTSAAGQIADIVETINSAGAFASKTVTLGCWVYASAGTNTGIVININDGIGSTSSSPHSNSAGWEYLTVTRSCDAGSTYLYAFLYVAQASTTAYFDGARVNEGSMGYAFSEPPVLTDTVVAETDETKFSHKMPVVIAGTTYYMMLTTT